MLRVSVVGTLESFMHHPANDRFWLNSESQIAILSVSFGENANPENALSDYMRLLNGAATRQIICLFM